MIRNRLLVAAVFAALGAGLAAPPLRAADGAGSYAAVDSQTLTLGIGKSYTVELPRDAKEVIVGNPAVANAVVRSARQAFLIGVALGQTNVFFLDAEGRNILALDINVARDVAPLKAAIDATTPGSNIYVEAVGEGVMLSGTAKSSVDAKSAVDIAARYVGDPAKVANSIRIENQDQVMLKVTVAEVQRNIIKQLGINWDVNYTIGTTVVGFSSSPPLAAAAGTALDYIIEPDSATNPNLATTSGTNGAAAAAMNSRGGGVANIKALEENNVARILAEPTLTAISGEAAEFLVGGEYPIPITDSDGKITIEFKKFGVGLNFTPVVLSGGRISVKVMTEVSELSDDGQVQIGPNTTPIKALRVRRANSTVELPSGGSIVLAGMLNKNVTQAINGLPGLKDVPILGTLFRSRAFQKSETELVVFVTPYLAKSVAPAALARPDDGFADSTDPEATFLGRVNRTYGGGAKLPAPYRANYGFIID